VKLTNAHLELERGHLKHALRLAWQEGLEAADRADASRLEQTETVANAIAERGTGRLQDDARMLATYCASARTNPGGRGTLWSALLRPSSSLRNDTKECPDCGERVNPAARVCRFCGYRFDQRDPTD
jgi:ribosomal protein L40E